MEEMEKKLKEINEDNLYHFLGVSSKATKAEIKSAYKTLSARFHPDKNPNVDTSETFQKVVKAYHFLKDESLKEHYDTYLYRKEQERLKYESLHKERRKFIDDLNKREKQHFEGPKENYFNRDYKKEKRPKEEESDEIQRHRHKKKEKTKDEKLNLSGIKVKWLKDSDYYFDEISLRAYFIQYGKIDEISIEGDDNKALILFNSMKSVNDVLSDERNVILKKLFKIEKYYRNVEIEENIEFNDIKFSFLDTNLLSQLKNKTLNKMSKETSAKESNETNPKPTKTKIQTNLSHLSLEELEKYTIERFGTPT